MKPRATLLVLFALAFLALDTAAQGRPPLGHGQRKAPATSVYGAYQRTKLLKTVRTREDTTALGSACRRALLTTGRLPASYTKPKRSRR
jgi:hypothetical protein